MRVFISLKLNPKTMIMIKEIQEKIPEFKGKKTEIQNLHLTLKFFGNISSEQLEIIKCKLREIKFSKFEAEVAEIGFFDNPNQGIVWLGITNCDLLQSQIDTCLEDLFSKEKRFMGHLTIARVKSILDKKVFLDKLKKIEIPKMFFIFDKFYLIESNLKKEGPEYRTIEEYSLK